MTDTIIFNGTFIILSFSTVSVPYYTKHILVNINSKLLSIHSCKGSAFTLLTFLYLLLIQSFQVDDI